MRVYCMIVNMDMLHESDFVTLFTCYKHDKFTSSKLYLVTINQCNTCRVTLKVQAQQFDVLFGYAFYQ